MKNKKVEANSIALNIELSILSDFDGTYRKKISQKLDKMEKDARSNVEKGASPKDFAKFSKLLHAVPAAREIINLYEPIKK